MPHNHSHPNRSKPPKVVIEVNSNSVLKDALHQLSLLVSVPVDCPVKKAKILDVVVRSVLAVKKDERMETLLAEGRLSQMTDDEIKQEFDRLVGKELKAEVEALC